jgi:hypothetical protein
MVPDVFESESVVSMTFATFGYAVTNVGASDARIAYPPGCMVMEPTPPFLGGTFRT